MDGIFVICDPKKPRGSNFLENFFGVGSHSYRNAGFSFPLFFNQPAGMNWSSCWCCFSRPFTSIDLLALAEADGIEWYIGMPWILNFKLFVCKFSFLTPKNPYYARRPCRCCSSLSSLKSGQWRSQGGHSGACPPPSAEKRNFFSLKTLNFVVQTAKIPNFSRLWRLSAPQANIFTWIQQFSNKKD